MSFPQESSHAAGQQSFPQHTPVVPQWGSPLLGSEDWRQQHANATGRPANRGGGQGNTVGAAPSHSTDQPPPLSAEDERSFYDGLSPAAFFKATGGRLSARFLQYFVPLPLFTLLVALLLPANLRTFQYYLLISITSTILVIFLGIVVLARFVRPILESTRHQLIGLQGFQPSIEQIGRMRGDVEQSIHLLVGATRHQVRRRNAIAGETLMLFKHLEHIASHLNQLGKHLGDQAHDATTYHHCLEIYTTLRLAAQNAANSYSWLEGAIAEKQLSSLMETSQEMGQQLTIQFEHFQATMKVMQEQFARGAAQLQ